MPARTERFGDETIYVIADGSDAEARVAPSLGANCLAFRTSAGGRPAHLISSPTSPDVWRQRPTFTGFPILAPYPGRHQVPFTWRGQRYEIEPNDRPGVAIHGIVAGAAWSVVDAGASAITCRFDSEAISDRPNRWPWPFTLTATHTVDEGALRLDLALENRSDEEIPHLLGLHPYFPIRFTPASAAGGGTHSSMPTADELAGPEPRAARETCEVFVLADELWEMRAGLGTGTIDRLDGPADLRRGRTVAELERTIGAPAGPGPFGDDRAVRGPRLPVLLYGKRAALRGPQAGTDPGERYGVISGVRDRASGIEATLESSAGFGSLAAFFPPGRPFISLEPRSAVSDALTLANDPRGLATGIFPLGPGQTWKAWVRLYARAL